MKAYVTQCCSDVTDYDILSNVEQLLVGVDKLPPNQRVLLQSLFEEVTDVLKEKRTDVDSMLECLQNAAAAYEVTVLS